MHYKRLTFPRPGPDAEIEEQPIRDEPDFIKNIQRPMARNEGDNLPVSLLLVWKMEPSPWVQQLMKNVELLL